MHQIAPRNAAKILRGAALALALIGLATIQTAQAAQESKTVTRVGKNGRTITREKEVRGEHRTHRETTITTKEGKTISAEGSVVRRGVNANRSPVVRSKVTVGDQSYVVRKKAGKPAAVRRVGDQ